MPPTWNDSCPSNFQKGKQHLLQFWFTNVRYLFDEEIKIISTLCLVDVLYRYFRKSYFTESWFPVIINACIYKMTTSETVCLRSDKCHFTCQNFELFKSKFVRNHHYPIFIQRSPTSYRIVCNTDFARLHWICVLSQQTKCVFGMAVARIHFDGIEFERIDFS